jgi:clan AA aspartic protease (TIGR02281 family)
MAAYVLIRETRKGRKAPLLACASMAAGLGLFGTLLGGTAYGDALAAGLSRFIVLPAPSHEPRPSEDADHVIRIKADSRGHYYVKGRADGVPFEFMIDSGSTNIVFPKADAERLHVGPLRFDVGTSTANGRIESAQITIHKLTVGSFTMSEVPALVNGGELDEPLLGAGWLGVFRSIEIKNGVMTLHY